LVDATSASTAEKRLGSGSTVEAKGKEKARLEASSCENRVREEGRQPTEIAKKSEILRNCS